MAIRAIEITMDLTVSLTINRAILMETKVIGDFLRLFL